MEKGCRSKRDTPQTTYRMCITVTGYAALRVFIWKFCFIFSGPSVILIEMFDPRRCVIHTLESSTAISLIQTNKNRNLLHWFPLFGRPRTQLSIHPFFFLKSKISGPVSKESFHHQFVNNHYFLTGQSPARVGCCSLTSPLSEWNRFRPLGLLHGPGSTVQVRNQWCRTVVQTCGIVPLGRAWGCHSA